MTNNIFKKYSQIEERNVFKNIRYLDPECIPNEFHYRDNEMAAIASNISPIFYGSTPIHTVVLGSNAAGKTTAIKRLWEEVREPLPEVIPVYINCRKFHTEYQVYGELYRHVMGKLAPVRGGNSRKLFTDVMRKLELTHQPLLVALDDANYLLGNNSEASPHSQNVIRNLVRAGESYGVTVGVFPVITSDEYRYKFDVELEGLFSPAEVCFHEYTREEFRGIICERCDYAFNVPLGDEVVDCVLDRVLCVGNVRVAWRVLKLFGLYCNVGLDVGVALRCALSES